MKFKDNKLHNMIKVYPVDIAIVHLLTKGFRYFICIVCSVLIKICYA